MMGRPFKYKSVKKFQEYIDKYFAETPEDEWTWTGLALHMDTSKQTLKEYKERPDFIDPIKKALLKVEQGYEKDLKRFGRSGTIFALKNFNWKDQTYNDLTSGGKVIPILGGISKED